VRRIVALTMCLALAAAACAGPEAEEVMTVDGKVFTLGDAADLYQQDLDSITIDSGFRLVVFRLLVHEVAMAAFEEDFGAEFDRAAADDTFESFMSEIDSQGGSIPDATGIPGAGEGLIRYDAILTVLREQVIEQLLADEDLLAGLMEDPALVTRACASHILVETEEEAQQALARLEDGEAFAVVATDMSLDTQSAGGDLGCNTPGYFVEPFADALMAADPGVPYGPVETPYGWHVILVESRTTPTAEQLIEDPRAYLSSEDIQQVWVGWFTEQLADADITMNPEYGAWDPDALRIVAPES
jgi:hypothetical protein